MSEYRIDELARRAETTVRNVRVYQDRGLLAPPRRAGRVGIYTDAHLARLRLIGQLLRRGYTFANIGEMLAVWERGGDLAEVLDLESAVGHPWSDEVPGHVTAQQLREAFGAEDTAENRARAVAQAGGDHVARHRGGHVVRGRVHVPAQPRGQVEHGGQGHSRRHHLGARAQQPGAGHPVVLAVRLKQAESHGPGPVLRGVLRAERLTQLPGRHMTGNLIGPRVPIHEFKRYGITPYGKALFGLGHMNFEYNEAYGRFADISLGGGIDMRLSKHWVLRPADFEYQLWPNWIDGTLKPYGLSAGIGYKIF